MSTAKIKLSKPQYEIFTDSHRFKVVVCGRRFGKTYLGAVSLMKAASIPNSSVMYVAPSYNQIFDPRDGVMNTLPQMIPQRNLKKVLINKKEIHLTNGSVISCRSGDMQKMDTLRGGGLNYLVLDEYADMYPQIWTLILRGRLADTKGQALFLGTPKGYNHFYELHRDAVRGFCVDDDKNIPLDGWKGWSFTTLQGGRVTEDEVEQARNCMTAGEFKQEFEASFTSLSNTVYSNFDPKLHVTMDIVYDPHKPIYVGMDFNIEPHGISVCIGQRTELKDGTASMDIIEAFTIKTDPTTDKAAQQIRNKYPDGRVICAPDPAMGQKTTTGITDWKILERYKGFTVRGPRKNPPIKDRVSNVQTNLLSANGKVRLRIHEKNAIPVIQSLKGHTYVNGVPDKKSGLDHMNDALGYMLWYANNLFNTREIIDNDFSPT